jgi:predicted secreted acid phosphatase
MFLKEKKIICLTIYLVFSFFGCEKTKQEVLNIYEAKNSVKQYHKSGKYLEHVSYQANQAKKYITNRLKKVTPNEKLAVVFDVDDTLLSNYEHKLETDFSQNINLINECQKKAQMPSLNPVKELYDFAKEKGLYIFIITGRKIDLKDPTINNLNFAGLSGWSQIFFDDSNYSTTADYKIAMRKQIANDGYSIIVNIGDQKSDLQGGFSEKTFKLPNYIYLIE